MSSSYLFTAALWLTLGCGSTAGPDATGEVSPGAEASASTSGGAAGGGTAGDGPAGLMCGGPFPDRCGVTREECRSALEEEILPACARALAAQMPPEPTEEQRQIFGGLVMLCSGEVYRQQLALAGHPCEDYELPERYRSPCLLCSVAVGTVRVVGEPAGAEPREESSSAAPEDPAHDE